MIRYPGIRNSLRLVQIRGEEAMFAIGGIKADAFVSTGSNVNIHRPLLLYDNELIVGGETRPTYMSVPVKRVSYGSVDLSIKERTYTLLEGDTIDLVLPIVSLVGGEIYVEKLR